MNKIKIAILSLFGGSEVFLRTCIQEERVLLNAEQNASKRVANIIKAEKTLLTAEIESTNVLKSRIEKIADILEQVPFDNIYDIYTNQQFINKINQEILIRAHIPVLRTTFKNTFKTKDSFHEEHIRELITTGSSQKYILKEVQLFKIRTFMSKTYADQYFAHYLERNSCNKKLLELLEEYSVKRQFEKDGPLNKQIAYCKKQNNFILLPEPGYCFSDGLCHFSTY